MGVDWWWTLGAWAIHFFGVCIGDWFLGSIICSLLSKTSARRKYGWGFGIASHFGDPVVIMKRCSSCSIGLLLLKIFIPLILCFVLLALAKAKPDEQRRDHYYGESSYNSTDNGTDWRLLLLLG